MKKIILLFLSFLGICEGTAQITGGNMPDSVTDGSLKKSITGTAAKEKVFVKLFPNPAKNKTELEIHGFEPGLIEVQIVNLDGKAERNDQRLLANGNETMVLMFSLPAGIYFVVLHQKDKLLRKKMVVQ